jgi:hypothetical protein
VRFAQRSARVKISYRTLAIGSATISLSAGQRTTLKLSLNPAGMRVLNQHHQLSAQLQVDQLLAGGNSKLVEVHKLVLKV